MSIETIADLQMHRFVATKSPGQIMESGLWSWSRHPNYFGEFGVWLSFGLFGFAAYPGASLRDYRSPARRWGSVLGPQRDGLVVFAPTGHGVRVSAWASDVVLQRLITRYGIYGGVRRTGDKVPSPFNL